MYDWAIYRIFVLNAGWKLESLQMKIFVYVYPTFSVVELKTRFETSIERNEINAVYTFYVQLKCTVFSTY
jgi:hypothetical protein